MDPIGVVVTGGSAAALALPESRPRRKRRPITDPEVLAKRSTALPKARAARAEKLAGEGERGGVVSIVRMPHEWHISAFTAAAGSARPYSSSSSSMEAPFA